MVDKMMKAEIIGTVRMAFREAMEIYKEVWLSEEQLLEQFQMLSPSWMKRYGEKLPRTKAKGSNRWGYPRNKIARMAAEGKLNAL